MLITFEIALIVEQCCIDAMLVLHPREQDPEEEINRIIRQENEIEEIIRESRIRIKKLDGVRASRKHVEEMLRESVELARKSVVK